MCARIERLDYRRARRLARPLVAFVNRPGVGHHALFVLKVEADRVRVIDPLSGSADTVTREEFMAERDPVILWLEPPTRPLESMRGQRYRGGKLR